ncbi:MAG: Gfo/Idh/MocA family oxidoreductase, partial [Mycobacterium sp.]|nr:Gfo/Idh/MocA family oxidoreductase [Mycobacterium sp.]
MKVAVVGLGNNGQAKGGHLTESELVEDIVVHDVDPDRTSAVVEKYRARPARDFDEILADSQIGLVAIATPNDTHAQLTVAALEAGKPVLCEKPMATTLKAATSMVDAAERTGGFLQSGFELRYSKLYTTIKEWIDAGLLGDVVNTHCTMVTSEYLGRRSWRADPEVCGDMFGEKLSHYVDLPRWWLPGEVRDIYAVSAPNIVPYFGIPDNYHAIYRFDDGTVSELSFFMGPASTIARDPLTGGRSRPAAGDGHELRYIVYGTRGAAQSEVYGRRLVRWELG